MRETIDISGENISEEAIRKQLSRVLGSPMFAQSERLRRFLCFTVEATLAGEGNMLKQYLIGMKVYDRKPPYDPAVDSIVRTEARRLRAKLKEYYELIGKNDPITIEYRPGSYAPSFRQQLNHDETLTEPDNILHELFAFGPRRSPGLSSLARQVAVQIVFEGTVRVFLPVSAMAADLPVVQPIPNPNRIHKVIPIDLAKSRRDTPTVNKGQASSEVVRE